MLNVFAQKCTMKISLMAGAVSAICIVVVRQEVSGHAIEMVVYGNQNSVDAQPSLGHYCSVLLNRFPRWQCLTEREQTNGAARQRRPYLLAHALATSRIAT
jgi:hypothetical protein